MIRMLAGAGRMMAVYARRIGLRLVAVATVMTVGGAWSNVGHAAPPVLSVPSDEDFQTGVNGSQGGGAPGYLNSLGRSNLLLGDMGGCAQN